MKLKDKKAKDIGRREFVKVGTIGAIAAALGIHAMRAKAVASTAEKMGMKIFTFKEKTYEKYWCMVIKQNLCIGKEECGACIDACNDTWNIPRKKGYYRTNVLELGRGGHLPVFCYQCENPACVAACPTKASYKREKDGIVLVDPKKCMGCKVCMIACPYDARYFNEEIYAIDKCTYCQPRLEKGELPACVEACPNGVRVFGDLNDKDSEVYKLLHQIERKVWTLHPEASTRPRGGYVKVDE